MRNLVYLILVVLRVVFLVLVLLMFVDKVLSLVCESEHTNSSITLVFEMTRVLIMAQLRIRTTIMKPDMGRYSSLPKYLTACRASNLLVLMILFDMVLHIPTFLITHLTIDSPHISIWVIDNPIANVLFLSILVSYFLSILIWMVLPVVKLLLIILKLKITSFANVDTVSFDIRLMPSFVKRQRFLVAEKPSTLLGWYQAYVILCIVGYINVFMYPMSASELIIFRLPHIRV